MCVPARMPVMKGPITLARVRSMEVIPMMAVRSSGRTTAAMNAVRGAWSMLFKPVRMKNSIIVKNRLVGAGKNRTAVLEGRWVKTMVLIRPSLLASGPAKMVDSEASR